MNGRNGRNGRNEMNGGNAVTDRDTPVVTFVALPAHVRAAPWRAVAGGRCVTPVDGDPWPLGTVSSPARRRPRRRLRQVMRSAARRLVAWSRRRFAGASDLGMSTAEYAVGTVAACGFAALLVYQTVSFRRAGGGSQRWREALGGVLAGLGSGMAGGP